MTRETPQDTLARLRALIGEVTPNPDDWTTPTPAPEPADDELVREPFTDTDGDPDWVPPEATEPPPPDPDNPRNRFTTHTNDDEDDGPSVIDRIRAERAARPLPDVPWRPPPPRNLTRFEELFPELDTTIPNNGHSRAERASLYLTGHLAVSGPLSDLTWDDNGTPTDTTEFLTTGKHIIVDSVRGVPRWTRTSYYTPPADRPILHR